MTKREFFKTFCDYDEDSLSTKSNKTAFVKNNIVTNIIKIAKVKKKEVQGQQRVLEENYLFHTHEIYESIEHKVKSKIETIF